MRVLCHKATYKHAQGTLKIISAIFGKAKSNTLLNFAREAKSLRGMVRCNLRSFTKV